MSMHQLGLLRREAQEATTGELQEFPIPMGCHNPDRRVRLRTQQQVSELMGYGVSQNRSDRTAFGDSFDSMEKYRGEDSALFRRRSESQVILAEVSFH